MKKSRVRPAATRSGWAVRALDFSGASSGDMGGDLCAGRASGDFAATLASSSCASTGGYALDDDEAAVDSRACLFHLGFASPGFNRGGAFVDFDGS